MDDHTDATPLGSSNGLSVRYLFLSRSSGLLCGGSVVDGAFMYTHVLHAHAKTTPRLPFDVRWQSRMGAASLSPLFPRLFRQLGNN